jgi:hypothetical protein
MTAYLIASLVLAAIFLAGSLVSSVEHRAAVVRLTAPAGVLVGLALALWGGDAWRTLGSSRDLMVLAGLAVVLGWWLVLALDRIEGHASQAALFGVAAAALPLFAATQWLVPALMFLAAIALATVLSAYLDKAGAAAACWAVGLCLIAGALYLAAGDGWARPGSLEGTEAALLMAGVGVLLWPLDLPGSWRAAGRASAAAIPLLHAAAFAALAAAGLASQPWAASGVLAVAVMTTLWQEIRSGGEPSPGALSTGACLAAALAVPSLAVPAGIAAVFGATVGSLGAPHVLGTALLGGVVPLSSGWLVLLAAITRSFGSAGGSADLADRLPWLVLAGLAPVVLVAGSLGIAVWTKGVRRAGRLRTVAGEGPLVLSLLGTAFPGAILRLGDSPLGTGRGVTWLLLVALAAGGTTAWILHTRAPATQPAPGASPSVGPPQAGRPERFAALAGLVLTAALGLFAAFVTVMGLKVGFL